MRTRERKAGSHAVLTLLVEQDALRALDGCCSLLGMNRQAVLLRGLLLACREVQQMQQEAGPSVSLEVVGPENMERVLSLMVGQSLPS